MVLTRGEPTPAPTSDSPPDAEALFKEARRRERRRRLFTGIVLLLVIALVAGLIYLVVRSMTSSGSQPVDDGTGPTTLDTPPAIPNNWTIVVPGGTSGSQTSPPRSLSVLVGNTNTLRSVPAPPSKSSSTTTYPWAVSGPYIGAVTDIVNDGNGSGIGANGSGIYGSAAVAEGVAYAFRPGDKAVRLGPAAAIYAAVQPGRFWLRQDSGGPNCSLVEVSATGTRLTNQLPVPCTRWLVAAVPGGFMSVPMSPTSAVWQWSGGTQTWEFGLQGGQPSPESPLQLWNPLTGHVVRSYAANPQWIVGVNSQYLVSQTGSQSGTARVEITNLASGATHELDLPVSPGQDLLNLPFSVHTVHTWPGCR